VGALHLEKFCAPLGSKNYFPGSWRPIIIYAQAMRVE
jgi:hypothetical protein